MATQDTLTGTLFAARYRMLRKLGGGGMADVYLAEDQELGRRVAVKILHERYANDEQFVERFRREARNAAGLSHPNIVSIYDRGKTNGSYFIVMEYVEGKTLKELIRTRGRCPIPVAIAYTRQILSALRYAHRHGVIHRDIKPHNVIVDPEGQLKVTDFGIARAGASQMTEEGAIIGTAQYLSPEQARGAPVDQTSDLYSCGVVLYELLTGEVPFSGGSPVEIAMKHLSETPRPPSELRSEVPHDLDLVVLRALAKESADRYQSAAAMDSDLEAVSRGRPVPSDTAEAATVVLAGGRVEAPSRPTEVVRTRATEGPPSYEPLGRRRRPLWPWLLAVGALLALAAGGWYAWTSGAIGGSSEVAVPYVVALREAQAVDAITKEGLVPRVRRIANSDVEEGIVFDQNPDPGARVAEGSIVVIDVSSGRPEVSVPSVIGKRVAEAVAELGRVGLVAQVVEVFSDREEGTVTAQQPTAGTVVVEGTSVRINVSKGARPVVVPSVVSLPYDQAAAELRSAGFNPVRVDVTSEVTAGVVIAQDPAGGVTSSRGATVTLQVSKGPQTIAVPDVTGLGVELARATLLGEGFRVRVILEDTVDPLSDGLVLSQDPLAGTQAKPGSTVRLVVGRFLSPPDTDIGTDTDTLPTETIP
ncbi:MAG: Stk1 family PASTA domain-containing Ser/Thr kinase [Thermoleophilia bacterium]|nr:Stk1 family PASTA domain-containing Ser/Thr kinase [Gaiellaceae bacterium]MDW8337998.1 Stk1 family PASTA domain-containing Ser/Thr kinase [Thermoleophilia bacterium]